MSEDEDEEISLEDQKLTRVRLIILPKFELVGVLKRIHKKKRLALQQRYEELRKQKIKTKRNIYEYLVEYGLVDIIIQMIMEKLNLESFKKIESLYVEYQHGSFPTFYFVSMTPPLKLKSAVKNKTELERQIKIWNEETNKKDLASIRNVELILFTVIEGEEIIEIEMFFEYMISYISPENLQPCYVYAHETAVVWLSPTVECFVIKARGKSITVIKDILRNAFRCKVEGVQLQQNVIDRVFGTDSIRSATFENPIRSKEKVDRHTLTDNLLSSKPLYRELLDVSDRKRSVHEMDFLRSLKMAQILKTGTISIRGKFRKSLIRLESIKLLKKLEKAISEIKNDNPLDYFGTKNPNDSNVLSVIKRQKGRELLYALANSVLIMNDKNQNDTTGIFEVEEFVRLLKEYFIPVLEVNCDVPGCTGYFKCPNCDKKLEEQFIMRKKGNLFCNNCSENINLNISLVLSCDHENVIPIREKLKLIILPGGKRLINQYYKEVEIEYQIPKNLNIIITHSLFQLMKSDFISVVDISELLSYRKLPPIESLGSDIVKTQTEIIEYKLGEKCQFHGANNCRSCLREYHGNCVQRVVCHFAAEASIWPHSSVERGDFEIIENYKGRKWKILGLAKAANGKIMKTGRKRQPKTLTRSDDDRLLGQALDAILNKNSKFIMMSSGAELDPTLRDMIEKVCEVYKVKLAYFLKKDLIRSYTLYREEVRKRFGKFKPIYRKLPMKN